MMIEKNDNKNFAVAVIAKKLTKEFIGGNETRDTSK